MKVLVAVVSARMISLHRVYFKDALSWRCIAIGVHFCLVPDTRQAVS